MCCFRMTNNMGCNSSFPGYKGSIATPGSVPSLRMTNSGDGPPPSVESPASITPSPLPPHSQPSSVPNHGSYHILLGITFYYYNHILIRHDLSLV